MYIASASTSVKFHEFSNSNTVHHYQPGSKVDGPIRSISWTKDGIWLAVVPHSGLAEIITVKGPQVKLLHTVQDITEPSCASFPNLTKRYLALGTKHGQVLLYDIKSRTTKTRFPRAPCMITHVGFTAKDTHCVAGCSNGEVVLYNNVAKNVSCTLKVPKSNSLTALQAHVQKRNLITGGSNEGVVVVWDSNVNKTKFYVDAHQGPVTSVAFSPINASLVISTGMDRQFSIYDVEARARIACIAVDNNLTAVDFIDDATYFAMASQNGKIHVYDSRHLQQPVYSFEAHQSAIKHLAFQNVSDESLSNNSSLGSLVTEDVKPGRLNEDEVQVQGKKRTSDIFGMMAQGSSIPEAFDGPKHPAMTSLEAAGDSFIAALGLDKNSTVDSIKPEDQSHHDESLNKLAVENKLPTLSLSNFTPNPSRSVHDKLALYDSINPKQTTSTPKLLSQNFLSNVSPIVSGSANQTRTQVSLPGVSVTEIHATTKEIVQEEVKKVFQDIKSEVAFQLMQSGQEVRKMVLNLHMAMVKEFMKVENCCNSIRDEIVSESPTSHESYLLEENMNLKKKIMILESQIASLSASSATDETENKD